MSLVREFISWYNNEFKLTELWSVMETTSENSPWHRERNVAVHTDMVVQELLSFQAPWVPNSEASIVASLFAAAFHDVGKPSCRQEKHSEERGTYYSYSGHELRSARLWQDYYMQNRTELEARFGIGYETFYVIAVMIEKHRPWGMKDSAKISGIFSSLGESYSKEYLNLLEADNTGRLTDSPDALAQSLAQIAKFASASDINSVTEYQTSQRRLNSRVELNESGIAVPQMIMPISQAGSGKSTVYNDVQAMDPKLNPTGANFYLHSMDIIRQNLYGDDPEAAFQASVVDKEFRGHVQADFMDAIRSKRSIYVDNTNLSAKRRRFYITEAQKHGYDIMAVLIPLSLKDAVARNEARTNKTIPTSVVIQQYMSLSMPVLGQEFDQIVFVD